MPNENTVEEKREEARPCGNPSCGCGEDCRCGEGCVCTPAARCTDA